MIVTIQHMHACPGSNGRSGLCARGGRAWCAQQGFDWLDFVANGIESDLLLATGDAMAARLVEFAQSEEANRE